MVDTSNAQKRRRRFGSLSVKAVKGRMRRHAQRLELQRRMEKLGKR